MGFINDNITDACNLDVKVYWTDKGKQYLSGSLKGRKVGTKVMYFTLGDDDTNYNISYQPGNILPHNFIPDISGTDPNCLDGTKHNYINYPLNFLSENLIKTKRYTIDLTDNTKPSTINCTPDTLIYKLYFNNDNIFLNDKSYQVYTAYNQVFYTKVDAQNYITNNITNNIKSTYENNVSVVSGIKQNTDNTYTITNIGFVIITEDTTQQVTDNVTDICNNSLSSTIKFETVIVSDPNPTNIVNNSSQTIILGCGDPVVTDIDCTPYYTISAFTFTTTIDTIYHCIVSNFGGWVG